MLELNLQRKNKINLSDYNSQQDIEIRRLISDFTTLELKVLEEILFSSLKISLKKMSRSLQLSEPELTHTLQKFAKGNLLTIEGDAILVDKEIRKAFEFQIQRFDEDFKPDMEFLQGLLKKVPIHLLPIWYSIPRSSDNIFESIVEKYLMTPLLFQRYLNDISFHEAIDSSIAKAAKGILHDLFAQKDYTLASTDAIAKYNLTRTHFEEVMLLLEFHFVCTVRYIKEEEHWHEVITPFHEWHQYLLSAKSATTTLLDPKLIQRQHSTDFAFIEELMKTIQSVKEGVRTKQSAYLLEKICALQLGQMVEGQLELFESADQWLALSPENKALYLYRHPTNSIDRYTREAEKSMHRIVRNGWVLFDDFLLPVQVDSVATLKKTGGQWKYVLPIYSATEKELIRTAIFKTFFESGIVAIGTYNGKDCFALTSFGRRFFEG